MENKNEESSTRVTPNPTTFLDLLNNTYDDADLVHILAEATDLTATTESSSFGFNSRTEEVNQNFSESIEFQNFSDNLDLVDEDAEYEEELIEDFEGGVYDFGGEYIEQDPNLIYMEENMFNGVNKDELQKETLLNDKENEQMDEMEEDDDEKYLSDNFG
jgi:hypothetical protein